MWVFSWNPHKQLSPCNSITRFEVLENNARVKSLGIDWWRLTPWHRAWSIATCIKQGNDEVKP